MFFFTINFNVYINEGALMQIFLTKSTVYDKKYLVIQDTHAKTKKTYTRLLFLEGGGDGCTIRPAGT